MNYQQRVSLEETLVAGGSNEPHDFNASLAMSHAADELPLWEECYRKAFPDFLSMVNHRSDGEHQRAGIDRSVILENSKQILIDEKIRGRNRRTGKVYPDVALEFWSDRDRKGEGWVVKPLRADYIAYAIAPLGTCYLLPVLQLQAAWQCEGPSWVEEFGSRLAKNRTGGRSWVTEFCPVPIKALFPAIGNQLRVDFTPFDWDETDE